MSNYLAVTKLLVKNMFKRDKGKKNNWLLALIIVFAIIYAAFMILMLTFVNLLAAQFIEMDFFNEIVTFILISGVVMVLFLGVVSMLSYLYFSKDTEFFLALPIKPSTVYLAKLTIIYAVELITTILCLLPVLFMLGALNNASVLYYISMFIGILLTPAIPLFFASILAIPLMFIVSFFKKRGALTSIFLIILFAALFGGYYMLILKFSSNVDSTGSSTEDTAKMLAAYLKPLCYVFYPLYALAKFSTFTPFIGMSVGVSMLINILIYLGTIVALFVLSVLISSSVYNKGAASQLEGRQSIGKSKGVYENSSSFKALVKKEWRDILRTPAFAFQCLTGIVLGPIVVVFINIMNSGMMTSDIPQEGAAIVSGISSALSYLLIAVMCIGTNIAACTVLTREGEKFYFCKLLPVGYTTQIKAKQWVSFMISAIAIVLSVAAYSIISFDWMFLIFGLISLLLFNYAFVCFGMFVDLRAPKLDWTTPNEAVKHNKNVYIPVFCQMGFTIIMMILPVILSVLIPNIIGQILMWGILIIIPAILAVVFHKLLYKNIDKFMERISV